MNVEQATAILRAEFGEDEGCSTFMLKLRLDLEWDHTRFVRLIDAMHYYVSNVEHGALVERWLAEGFWYLSYFVEEWSQHPNFSRLYRNEYYTAAYGRLRDLAYWFFYGESPYQDGHGFEAIHP